MQTKKNHEGYFQIDHRFSPGNDRVPEGSQLEAATYVCAHCQYVVVKNPKRVRPREWCYRCDAYVCDKPQCRLECYNFYKLIDQLQEQAFKGLNLKEI